MGFLNHQQIGKLQHPKNRCRSSATTRAPTLAIFTAAKRGSGTLEASGASTEPLVPGMNSSATKNNMFDTFRFGNSRKRLPYIGIHLIPPQIRSFFLTPDEFQEIFWSKIMKPSIILGKPKAPAIAKFSSSLAVVLLLRSGVCGCAKPTCIHGLP